MPKAKLSDRKEEKDEEKEDDDPDNVETIAPLA